MNGGIFLVGVRAHGKRYWPLYSTIWILLLSRVDIVAHSALDTQLCCGAVFLSVHLLLHWMRIWRKRERERRSQQWDELNRFVMMIISYSSLILLKKYGSCFFLLWAHSKPLNIGHIGPLWVWVLNKIINIYIAIAVVWVVCLPYLEKMMVDTCFTTYTPHSFYAVRVS